MGGRKKSRALGNQGVQCGIRVVVGPKYDFDPAPFSLRSKPVVFLGCLNGRDSESESIKRELDVDWFARFRGAKSLNKAEAPNRKPQHGEGPASRD